MIMSQPVKYISDHRSRMVLRKQLGVLRETCLLCRILWPTFVQHRHLLFEPDAEVKRPIQGEGPIQNAACPKSAG